MPVGEGCRHELVRLRSQRAELLARQARLDESLRLERESGAALRQTLDGQAKRIAELEQDLAFYRHLAQTAAAGDARLIQGLQLRPGEGDRRFRYRVTLVRPSGARRTVQGRLTLTLNGVRDGRKVRLEGGVVDPGDPHPVSFRYFQVVEGILELPSGFTPRTVAVTFKPKTGGSFVRIFSWEAAVGGAARGEIGTVGRSAVDADRQLYMTGDPCAETNASNRPASRRS